MVELRLQSQLKHVLIFGETRSCHHPRHGPQKEKENIVRVCALRDPYDTRHCSVGAAALEERKTVIPLHRSGLLRPF
jgi:hypothetical protein